MKLTSTRAERVTKQFDARAIPSAGLMARSFNELFGEHTFFLSDDGLSIVEAGHLANEVLRPGTLHAVHLFTK